MKKLFQKEDQMLKYCPDQHKTHEKCKRAV